LERYHERDQNQAMIATAAAIAAGAIAATPSADARTYVRHYYGYAGTYARATRVYAADHYYRRPPWQSVNPDFQLGGNRSR
jgi:hypothetical protein